MVGALGNDPEMVARLAITERSEAVGELPTTGAGALGWRLPV